MSPRKSLVCRWAGALFLFAATIQLCGAVIVAVWPGPALNCKQEGSCRWSAQPVRMLDDEEASKVRASPGAEQTLNAFVARPIVRLGILGSMLVEDAPFAVLLLGVGSALRRLGTRSGDPLASALPWLSRASLASIVWSVAAPLSDSLLASLLSPGTPEGGQWTIHLDLGDVGTALMLAIAAYATVWALEAGLKAQRDLAEFV